MTATHYTFVSHIFMVSLNVEKRGQDLRNKGVENSLQKCWPMPRKHGPHIRARSVTVGIGLILCKLFATESFSEMDSNGAEKPAGVNPNTFLELYIDLAIATRSLAPVT